MNQIPNIEETHNTREIEEIVEQFEKRMPLITSHGLLLEARLTPTSYLKMKEWLRTTLHQQLQKARESNEWKDPKTEVPDFEVDVLCDLLNHTTGNHHYAILKRMDEEDAEWFTSDDESELNAWNYVVVGWKYINHPYHSELDQPK